jgi:hypothetical protein
VCMHVSTPGSIARLAPGNAFHFNDALLLSLTTKPFSLLFGPQRCVHPSEAFPSTRRQMLPKIPVASTVGLSDCRRYRRVMISQISGSRNVRRGLSLRAQQCQLVAVPVCRRAACDYQNTPATERCLHTFNFTDPA